MSDTQDQQEQDSTSEKTTRKERRADRKESRPPKQDKEPKDRKGQAKKAAAVVGEGTNRVRTLVARIIWAVAVVLALILALGALLVALDANRGNDLVDFVLRAADAVDLGVFSRSDGIKTFSDGNAALKNALFNWGLGAVAWLVIGRVLDRIIRP